MMFAMKVGREGGRVGRREGGREAGRQGGKQGGREGGRREINQVWWYTPVNPALRRQSQVAL